MPEISISSFKYGLDTRREQLTSQSGTLAVLTNAYINEGGEIAKRGLFQDLADLTNVDTLGNTALFPGIFIGANFYVFGSALPVGSSVTQGQPVVVGTPSTVGAATIYQQIKHPSIANDSAITYDDTIHRMTKLVFVDVFAAKPVVVALFVDGNAFLYYDGSLVQQSANGLVLTGRTTLGDLSDDLYRQLLAVNWDSVANVDENGTSQPGSTIAKSPANDYFGAVADWTSTLGYLGYRFIDKDTEHVTSVRAFASFKISVAGTFSVTAPANVDGTGTFDLCGGTVSGGTVDACALAIVTAINDFSSYHGYTAKLSTAGGVTDEVTVFAPDAFDVSTAIVVTVTGSAGGASIAATQVPPLSAQLTAISGTLNGNALVQSLTVTSSALTRVGAAVSVAVGGGSTPYKAVIAPLDPTQTDPLTAYGIRARLVNSGSGTSDPIIASFTTDLSYTTSVRRSGTYLITVTDNAGSAPIILQVTVDLSIHS